MKSLEKGSGPTANKRWLTGIASLLRKMSGANGLIWVSIFYPSSTLGPLPRFLSAQSASICLEFRLGDKNRQVIEIKSVFECILKNAGGSHFGLFRCESQVIMMFLSFNRKEFVMHGFNNE